VFAVYTVHNPVSNPQNPRNKPCTFVAPVPGPPRQSNMRFFKWQGGYESKQDVPLPLSALSGSIAGISYWSVPYPADSIKSRIQTDPRMAGKGFFEIGASTAVFKHRLPLPLSVLWCFHCLVFGSHLACSLWLFTVLLCVAVRSLERCVSAMLCFAVL
jgi:hypothetical protein